jgi:hypothetical protein
LDEQTNETLSRALSCAGVLLQTGCSGGCNQWGGAAGSIPVVLIFEDNFEGRVPVVVDDNASIARDGRAYVFEQQGGVMRIPEKWLPNVVYWELLDARTKSGVSVRTESEGRLSFRGYGITQEGTVLLNLTKSSRD